MERACGGSNRAQAMLRSCPQTAVFDFDALFGTGRSSSGDDAERDRIGFAFNDPAELRRLCGLAEAGDFEAPLQALADLGRAGDTLQHVLTEALSFGVCNVVKPAWSDPIDELEYELGWRARTGAWPLISIIF